MRNIDLTRCVTGIVSRQTKRVSIGTYWRYLLSEHRYTSYLNDVGNFDLSQQDVCNLNDNSFFSLFVVKAKTKNKFNWCS